MPNLTFQTQVSGEKNGVFVIRGEKHEDLIASSSFVQTLYLALTGRQPDAAQAAVLDAVLVACIDHGIAPASGFVPRVVAASGNELTHSIAAGVLAIGLYHGGAIQSAGQLFSQLSQKKSDLQTLVTQYKSEKKVFFGFGHRVYKENDPRTLALFTKADNLGLSNTHRSIALALEAEIASVYGKKLVLNVDGAVAALILDLGLPLEAGNGIFALARVGGMIPHILEEYSLKSPVRRLEDSDITYSEI